jgi:hypothetical protein
MGPPVVQIWHVYCISQNLLRDCCTHDDSYMFVLHLSQYIPPGGTHPPCNIMNQGCVRKRKTYIKVKRKIYYLRSGNYNLHQFIFIISIWKSPILIKDRLETPQFIVNISIIEPAFFNSQIINSPNNHIY